MARSFNGTNQYLSLGSAVVSSLPLTMACWFNPTNLTATGILMSIFTASGTSNGWYLEVEGTVGSPNDSLHAVSFQAGTATLASTATTYSTSKWQHACAVYASATSRAVYLNGGGKGTDATSNTPSGMTTTSIAAFSVAGSFTEFYNGLVAEAAIWNTALTDQEVASLATGIAPRRVRPANLVAYWPLWGLQSPEPDMSGNARNLTLTNAPSQANHAPVRPFTWTKPALAYPPYLFPPSGGIAPIARPAILSGGRL